MNKYLLFVMLAGFFASCGIPRGLPGPEDLPHETRGAHIHVQKSFREHLNGELIAVHGDELVVLPDLRQYEGPVVFHVDDIYRFRIYYAQGISYNWALLIYPPNSILHGVFGLISLPATILFTSLLHFGSVNEYALRPKDVSLEELKKFSRFPQDVPEGVDLKDIR